MTVSAPSRRSPLHDWHAMAGAKFIDFHGWVLPVQYTSILDEHQAVRQAAGLFDISHMGQILIEGAGAFAFLQRVMTGDLQRTFDKGLGIYSHLCLPTGGVIDDIFVYGLKSPERFFMVVNGATHEKDVAWLRKNAGANTAITDLENRAGFAIQGPRALEIIRQTLAGVAELPRFAFQQITGGAPNETFWACRTGYTGEEGAEFFGPVQTILALWKQLMENGKALGLKPCGLGARDTLRLEMGYPLYGHELDETHTSLESNMEWVVKWGKGDFIGRAAMEKQKAEGLKNLLMGFELTERGIPRQGYNLLHQGKVIAQAASGTFSPTLQKGIGTAFFPIALAKTGMLIEVELPGKRATAHVTQISLFKK